MTLLIGLQRQTSGKIVYRSVESDWTKNATPRGKTGNCVQIFILQKLKADFFFEAGQRVAVPGRSRSLGRDPKEKPSPGRSVPQTTRSLKKRRRRDRNSRFAIPSCPRALKSWISLDCNWLPNGSGQCCAEDADPHRHAQTGEPRGWAIRVVSQTPGGTRTNQDRFPELTWQLRYNLGEILTEPQQ